MNNDEFESVLNESFQRISSILVTKAKEYAQDTDRLYNFKQAGHLQGVTTEQALGGFLAKHIVSIFDLIGQTDNHRDSTPMAVWDEKIFDALNYLILLRAILVEKNPKSSNPDYTSTGTEDDGTVNSWMSRLHHEATRLKDVELRTEDFLGINDSVVSKYNGDQ